ncbi:MAG: NAD(P)/FAD-dependent oxidoreductase [Ignavibacteria bacterium]|nr:NAD(P)/FAD-dependent oxidoreductase [Ignavibacteria bacterium]
MTAAEVIIVGGGPAGSTCAWELRQAGIETIILDKQDFPRAKPCAGWITPRVVRNLRLKSDGYPHSFLRLDKLRLHFSGRSFSLPTRQFSIRRYEFDEWLLKRAGVPVYRHTVKEIGNDRDSYLLDGTYRCSYLVGAGGTHCPVYRAMFSELNPRRADAQITAVEAEVKCDPADRGCHLWFSERGLQGYSWYLPKGNGYLNVGVGGRSTALEARGETIRDHWAHLARKLADFGFADADALQPNGHTYYLRHATPTVQRDNAFIIGDAAGLATKDLGEGIGPAVESGIRAARAIIHRTEYSVKSIPKYSLPDLILPWRL